MRMKKKWKWIISAAVAVIALAFLTGHLIQTAGISAVRAKGHKTAKETVGAELVKGKQELCVAESETKRLLVDPSTMNVIVEDKGTGRRYEAICTQSTEPAERSLLVVNYVGEDNQFYQWDSFTYSVENDTYQLYQRENGVRIQMNLNEGESARFYEYMPQKMSVEHYETVFLAGLEALVESGEMEKSQANKYKNTLNLVYQKSKTEDCYNVGYIGQPPKSAVTQLIALAKAVGYTKEHLLADADRFGFTVTFTEPAVFDVALDITLEGDELVVKLPVTELVSGNAYYQIQNIEVFMNFCTVEAAAVEEGYLFVPDGAGALMKMNTYNSKVPDYIRGFYDNDFYTDYYYLPEYAQELMMPVYGMLYVSGTREPFGFLSIVESGADTTVLEAMLASGEVGVGRQYNKIYTTYDVSQYEWVPVFGEYSDNKSTYLVLAPETETDFIVRYLLYGEEVSYYRMAKDYQSYLLDGVQPQHYATEASVYLEAIGTLSLEERFLGIPYDTTYSMTTYTELTGILTELQDMNLTVSYLGVFDGGLNHKLMRKGKLTSANGSSKELAALKETAKAQNIPLYLETDFLRVYSGGNGFSSRRHGLQDYKEVVERYGFSPATGMYRQYTNHYKLLNPNYLVDTVQDFLSSADGNDSYYLKGLASQYYADYSKRNYVSPADAQSLIVQAIESFPAGTQLAFDNPRADRLIYGSLAVDVSRESSDYSTFYATIPFRQLVMNGMLSYTTTSANNNSDSLSYILLQAVELGAQPKFLITAKNVDVLRDSRYSYLFSTQYEYLKEDIHWIYEQYEAAKKVIGEARITDHRMLEPGVYRTEYANGTTVIVNYNGMAAYYEDQRVEPENFLLLEGR